MRRPLPPWSGTPVTIHVRSWSCSGTPSLGHFSIVCFVLICLSSPSRALFRGCGCRSRPLLHARDGRREEGGHPAGVKVRPQSATSHPSVCFKLCLQFFMVVSAVFCPLFSQVDACGHLPRRQFVGHGHHWLRCDPWWRPICHCHVDAPPAWVSGSGVLPEGKARSPQAPYSDRLALFDLSYGFFPLPV